MTNDETLRALNQYIEPLLDQISAEALDTAVRSTLVVRTYLAPDGELMVMCSDFNDFRAP